MIKSVNKNNCLLFFLFFLTVANIGCLRTRSEVKDTESKNVMQQQVITLQRTNADINSKFSEVDEQFRELSGKVENLESKVSKINPEHDKSIKNIVENQSDVAKKISLLQEELTKQELQLQSLQSEIQNLKSNQNEMTAEKVSDSKKSHYQQADELFKKSEWKKAIISFQKYRDENPKGKFFLESTYKMAVSFQELGMKEEAAAFFKEVITTSSNSVEAKKAKQRLKSLKK
ncbi:MAG: tetratricopeptide repeat protein [Bdellovibrionaceae bacterium]|nr:tetratricopeptide repeat protein [Pseudobdellovibrionaceae bacterium]NUM59540.1 tetratricopeptide repeat protein [Pseudobdellovibrionaceae bacterium]